MKLKFKLYLVLSFLFQTIATNVYGEAIYGSFVCFNDTYTDIDVYGSSQFSSCSLSGNSNIFGTFSANDSTFVNKLKVYGSSSISNSKFSDTIFSGTFLTNNSSYKKLTVFGSTTIAYSTVNDVAKIFSDLNADETTFEKDIILWGRNNYIKNSLIKGNIIIRSFSKFLNISQTLNLDNVRVDGDVVFKNNVGIINLINNATVCGNTIGVKPTDPVEPTEPTDPVKN
ncbi:hypothetical protein [Spirobacillus cienkowskii]|jgi:hypothetical protein|uniref:Polymer-forming cytoskeletal protein n=1 Tax=Spirobacillus cienkowskii TaxID=495820 RepID=A0A369KPR5_9BACT|nr:MAG: hypothetical protein DCC88_10445 [Spirobacillus cienkowskii]